MGSGAAPAGYGLGKANFTLGMDAGPLVRGMSAAEAQVKAGAQRMEGNLSHFGSQGARSLLQVSYAIDDLQYGFRSVVNNIPQMLMFLGPGIAGAAGVAAVGVNILINHWGELADKLNARWSGEPIARLEAMRKAADEAADAFARMSKESTKAMSARSKSVEDVFTEGPIGKIAGELKAAIAAKGRGADPGVGMADVMWSFLGMRTDPQKRIDAENDAKTADLMGKAVSKDPEVAKAAMSRIHLLNPALADRLKQAIELPKRLEEAESQDKSKAAADAERDATAARIRAGVMGGTPVLLAQDVQAQQAKNKAEQQGYMRRMQGLQDSKVQGMASQMMRSPLGQLMFRGTQGTGPMTSPFPQVQAAMKRSGGNMALVPDVVAAMKAQTEDAIVAKMRETGSSRLRARQELALENVQKNDPDFGHVPHQQKSAFVGLAEFAKHIQAGALDNVPLKQLTQAQETNRLLRIMLGRPPAPPPDPRFKP